MDIICPKCGCTENHIVNGDNLILDFEHIVYSCEHCPNLFMVPIE